MNAPRVTLANVALRAGVSRSTASFVMSGRGAEMRISEAAQQKVLKAAADLGYRPNLTARSLRTSKTHTIGLISDAIATTPFAGEVIHGALDAALAHGHLLFVAETAGNEAVEADLISEMLDRQVDGIVYATMFTRYQKAPAVLSKVQSVLINCLDPTSSSPRIVPDEYQGGRTAARALADAGHLNGIYVIGGRHDIPKTPGGLYAGVNRMRGVEDELRTYGAGVVLSYECEYEPAFGYKATTELLSDGHRPRALICLNDRLAFGAYQALGERGMRVPEDVSVVSFDASDLASWLRPSLTSVALPHYELGKIAVTTLLDAPVRKGGESKDVLVPMPLHEGDSIAPVTPVGQIQE
ncbi:LacI family DNA-binding transcriptional regulator [Hoyosella altamirensis]|uniref:LacI family transcriptional regulator n=1 Tax=Hoyosella altamirensis TaxID=616997 RepID=A0A839RH57_9ACTN|nr:LacI family DNA-binding transcriptional regulator [Hoyosella altamirensis]MBB3035750.1 LacI family transcriptional regulator [Hoyosella altamirensis]